MSERQCFFFDRIRSSADNKKEIVVQGYAADGYLDTMRPRAAIFVGGRAVKALKCRLETVKLPPIMMRRRQGDTISYLGIIYIDMSSLTEDHIRKYGSGAKLVIVGENQKNRIMIHKDSLVSIWNQIEVFNSSVDYAYVEDGRTIIKGWLAGSEATNVKISENCSGSSDEKDYLKYSISFSSRDDVLMKYPELPDDTLMGFEISVDGIHKKLSLTMSECGKTYTQMVRVGKSDEELEKANPISRYSEKVVRNLKNYGVRETLSKVKVRLSPTYVTLSKQYNKWIRKNSPNKAELDEQKRLQKDFNLRPLFSILVPLYETDEKFLTELIQSIKAQTYPNWEICFSDGSKDSSRLKEIVGRFSAKDSRIRYVDEEPGPLGISSNTNQAFSIAKGDFIVLGDHDDLITPDALFECVKAMNEPDGSDIDVIYTDEDKTNATARRRFEPNIKPDFNQELLESCNYITHMFVARKSLVDEVGLFDDTYNGAQDYDFILRCTEKARKIHHIPRIVYSWRINETSTAGNPAAKMYAYDAGVKALQAHYDRMGINAKAEIGDHLGYYHTRYEIPEESLVFVAVMDANSDDAYNKTVESIKNKSDFKSLEFIRSEDGDLAVKMNIVVDSIKKDLSHKGKSSDDVYVMFIQAGVTMMGEDGISNMLNYLAGKPEVGAIGGKIYAVGGSLSHAGFILDIGSIKGWMYTRHNQYNELYFNYSAYSALRRGVTLIRLNDLERYGAFDEDFTGEYAMIDYTYKMSLDGRKCIYDANANYQIRQARGRDGYDCFETVSSMKKECGMFMDKHPEVAKNGDIYYSNLL